jgi:hypothetical protein
VPLHGHTGPRKRNAQQDVGLSSKTALDAVMTGTGQMTPEQCNVWKNVTRKPPIAKSHVWNRKNRRLIQVQRKKCCKKMARRLFLDNPKLG